MTRENYLGIDPGKSGAMAVIGPSGDFVSVVKLAQTMRDVWDWLDEHRAGITFAVLEKVHSMPGQGVASTFKFGVSYGSCEAMLVAASIRYEKTTPQKWQRAMGCLSGGDKNVTKARAQALYPSTKITHAIADALLIADYARRVRARATSSAGSSNPDTKGL